MNGTNTGNTQENKNRLVSDGNIYLTTEFDEHMMAQIPSVHKLYSEQAHYVDGKVEIHINSYGGYSDILWHLIDIIEMYRGKVKTITYVHSVAYSCGSMLAIAGDQRYISRNSEHLIHYGSASTGRVISPLDLDRNSGRISRHFKRVVDHYKKYANIPDLEDIIKDDNLYITPSKCIKWGLADKLIEQAPND